MTGRNLGVEGAPNRSAQVELLRQMRRDIESFATRPYVNIGGQYRLEVDGAGNLVAVHPATDRRLIIMTPT